MDTNIPLVRGVEILSYSLEEPFPSVIRVLQFSRFFDRVGVSAILKAKHGTVSRIFAALKNIEAISKVYGIENEYYSKALCFRNPDMRGHKLHCGTERTNTKGEGAEVLCKGPRWRDMMEEWRQFYLAARRPR